jgi:hypothetical protein
MAYTKQLIGNITKGAITQRGNKRLQALADKVDDNLADIEQALSDVVVEGVADVVGAMVSGNTETGLELSYDDSANKLNATVTYGTTAGTACVGNDARLPTSDEKAALAGTGTPSAANKYSTADHSHAEYQADLTATSTLADMGVAAIDPAFSGALTGITNASTLAELLAAIDGHTHT